ncbi:hypothetical protein NDU88_003691 [Pleurodeles waltl]|uniref:Uncharacterized protein n=1 Tax=Pleurodeles waltl TaxID=8319 RepID=A0AAV7UF35_PLEWA|nr:hypothetical protein NDU88_003691 [Pleurodeles waltl]
MDRWRQRSRINATQRPPPVPARMKAESGLTTLLSPGEMLPLLLSFFHPYQRAYWRALGGRGSSRFSARSERGHCDATTSPLCVDFGVPLHAEASSYLGAWRALAYSTVRQLRRKSKGLDPSRDNAESSAPTRKALKWDYSGTNLMSTVEAHPSQNATKGAEESVYGPAHTIVDRHTDSEMLQSIYNSIKELQTETRVESRRARLATKQLQGTVHKVVKSCIEIEGKLSSMEERTSVVEGEIEALRAQTITHEVQLTDIMWKLED